MSEDRLTKLIAKRNLHAPPIPKDKSAFEEIKAYIEDTTNTIILSPENKKILDRWKNIHALRLDGYDSEKIITAITKLHDVCEKTVRRDFKYYTKIFRYDFDPDYEMYLAFLQVEAFLKKARDAGDSKLIDRLLDKKIKLIEYFKGDGSLPSPDLFTQININITANPEDVGLEKVDISMDKLMKMFREKKKKIELSEKEGEYIEHEDVSE